MYSYSTSFRAQLARYGIRASGLRHLVMPDRFTAEEIAEVSFSVESESPAVR